tara:strand:- start:284 stop:1720 length:1437 start_codon:yes stop_codon:yes gene_type:complete
MFLYLCLLNLVAFSQSLAFNISTIDCSEQLVFVLDSSSSINNPELFGRTHTFRNFKNKIITIINTTNVKPENIGLVSFDTTPKLIFNFNHTIEKQQLFQQINTVKYHRKTKHTNMNLALQLIEETFIRNNSKTLKVVIFTDTHVGDEFSQPDSLHYNYIKATFKNKYWNNDYIQRFIYYEGSKINQSVLNLFNTENQFHINEPFRTTCKKQKCLDTFCIKFPEEEHKICVNENSQILMYNTYCHYFCSSLNLYLANLSLVPMNRCYTNQTHNIIYNFTKKSIEQNTTSQSSITSSTTSQTSITSSTTSQTSITSSTTSQSSITSSTTSQSSITSSTTSQSSITSSTTSQSSITSSTTSQSSIPSSKPNKNQTSLSPLKPNRVIYNNTPTLDIKETTNKSSGSFNIFLILIITFSILIVLILIFLLCIGIILYNRHKKPDSDNSEVLENSENPVNSVNNEDPTTYKNRLFRNGIYDTAM